MFFYSFCGQQFQSQNKEEIFRSQEQEFTKWKNISKVSFPPVQKSEGCEPCSSTECHQGQWPWPWRHDRQRQLPGAGGRPRAAEAVPGPHQGQGQSSPRLPQTVPSKSHDTHTQAEANIRCDHKEYVFQLNQTVLELFTILMMSQARPPTDLPPPGPLLR